MSILLYHYKQLTACISDVERIEAKVNSKKKEWLTEKKEEEEEQQPPEEEPPEFVAFCLQASDFLGEVPVCFNTSEECERAEELLLEANIDIISDCKGVNKIWCTDL